MNLQLDGGVEGHNCNSVAANIGDLWVMKAERREGEGGGWYGVQG